MLSEQEQALVEEVARVLWCAELGDPNHWDGRTGNQWAAYMAGHKPAFYAKAAALLPILARQRNEAIEAAAVVADAEMDKCNQYVERRLGGDSGVATNTARYQTARSIANAIRALKEPE